MAVVYLKGPICAPKIIWMAFIVVSFLDLHGSRIAYSSEKLLITHMASDCVGLVGRMVGPGDTQDTGSNSSPEPELIVYSSLDIIKGQPYQEAVWR
jgi:hypothetical protein